MLFFLTKCNDIPDFPVSCFGEHFVSHPCGSDSPFATSISVVVYTPDPAGDLI